MYRLLQRVPVSLEDPSKCVWQFQMALQLVQQRLQGPRSPWASYIQQLPGVAPGVAAPQVPMLWSEEELLQLQHAPLVLDARAQAHWWREVAAAELQQLPGSDADPFGGQLVSQDLLGWGLAMAMSRSFNFSGGHTLAPLIDMADHDAAHANAAVSRRPDDGAVDMSVTSPIAAGEPVTICYGRHNSANLLLAYGFTVPFPENPNDKFDLELDLDVVLGAVQQLVDPGAGGFGGGGTRRASELLLAWQRSLLQDLGLLARGGGSDNGGGGSGGGGGGFGGSRRSRGRSGGGSRGGSKGSSSERPVAEAKAGGAGVGRVSLGGSPPVSPALLAALRVSLCTERARVAGLSLEELGKWGAVLDADHEVRVMKALVVLATVLYKALPTTIQEDRRLLAQLQPASTAGAEPALRALLAVEYRLGAKQVLEGAARDCLLRMKELEVTAAPA